MALALARQRRGDLDRVFVVDSTPSARPDARGSESTRHIVELLTQLPDEFPDRQTFTAVSQRAPELVAGLSATLAGWLAPERPDVLGT